MSLTDKHEKSLIECARDIPVYMCADLQTVKENILFGFRGVTKNFDPQAKTVRTTIKKRYISAELDQIENLVVGIRDNHYLINTLANYKKLKNCVSFIYIESVRYISFILKQSNKYPLLIIRIPIDTQYALIDNSMIDTIISFRVDDIIVTSTGTTTSSIAKISNYRLYVARNASGFTMTLEFYSDDKLATRNISGIDLVAKEKLQELLQPNKLRNGVASGDIKLEFKDESLSYAIMNQTIQILKKLAINEKPVILTATNINEEKFLKFENDKLNIVTCSNDRTDNIELLNKNTTNYWPNIVVENLCYNFSDFDVVFKTSCLNATTTNEDSVYYLLTTFLNLNMFIKVKTNQNIRLNSKRDKLYTYQEIFNEGTQILEMYLITNQEENDENAA